MRLFNRNGGDGSQEDFFETIEGIESTMGKMYNATGSQKAKGDSDLSRNSLDTARRNLFPSNQYSK